MNEKKKITAAISAVMSYLQEEEAAVAALQAAAAPPNEPAGNAPSPMSVSLWGLSGRQAQMQMRSLMQLKAFHRLR